MKLTFALAKEVTATAFEVVTRKQAIERILIH